MVDGQVAIPLTARLALGRAAVQVLARDAGAEILHIKGNAVDPSLRAVARSGTDVDMMARPSHVTELDRTLRQHGWVVYSSFAYGSPFEHAQTYWHDTWGYLDLHRWFPGIRLEPEAAFEALWRDRTTMEVGGVTCEVPDVAGQAVILILNTARSGGIAGSELEQAWRDWSPEFRARVRRLVGVLDAPTAFAAAFGRLSDAAQERDYPLWRVVSLGGSRIDEWRARVAAARTPMDALKIILRAPRVNTEQLRHDLGHPPSSREIASALAGRVAQAARELGDKTRSWVRRRQ